MKVLFLVAELESANGICVQSVVKHLAERNTEVHVLTCHDQTTEKYKNENSSITVVSIPTKGFARITEWLKGIEGKLKGPANALSSNLHRIWVLACYPCWPMTSVLRVWQFAARAIQIVKDKDIDIVIPIFNSIEMLTAGYWVKKKNRKVKLVPYFLDALSAGQKPRFMREETRLKKALWWEKKLLSDAEGVVMMASAKKSYEKMQQKLDYQDRITFLDIPMLTPQEIPTSRIQRRHFPKEEVIFFFAGAMARNIRDPKYFIELFSSITEPSWNLYLAGSSDYMQIVTDSMKKDSRIHYLGRLPHTQIKEMMEEADYLVNLGNSLSYMVPSKIFEYMAYNKPIVSTTKIVDDPCLPYLKQYGNAVLLDESKPIENGGIKLQDFVRERNTEGKETVNVFDLAQPGGALYANTPAAFASYLDQINQKAE